MRNRLCLSVLSALCATACSVNLYSPPTLGALDQQATSLRAGQTAVTGTATYGGSPSNPETTESTLRVEAARGFADRLQLGGSLAVGRLAFPADNAAGDLADGTTGQVMARVYAKTPLVMLTRHRGLAGNVIVGAGVGHVADAATVASIDLGANFGYQNCVLSPTIAAAYYYSAPLARQEIRARDNDATVFSSYELPQTNGLVAGLGLTLETSREKCLNNRPRLQVIVQSEFLHFESAQNFDGTGRSGISLRYRF